MPPIAEDPEPLPLRDQLALLLQRKAEDFDLTASRSKNHDVAYFSREMAATLRGIRDEFLGGEPVRPSEKLRAYREERPTQVDMPPRIGG